MTELSATVREKLSKTRFIAVWGSCNRTSIRSISADPGSKSSLEARVIHAGNASLKAHREPATGICLRAREKSAPGFCLRLVLPRLLEAAEPESGLRQ